MLQDAKQIGLILVLTLAVLVPFRASTGANDKEDLSPLSIDALRKRCNSKDYASCDEMVARWMKPRLADPNFTGPRGEGYCLFVQHKSCDDPWVDPMGIEQFGRTACGAKFDRACYHLGVIELRKKKFEESKKLLEAQCKANRETACVPLADLQFLLGNAAAAASKYDSLCNGSEFLPACGRLAEYYGFIKKDEKMRDALLKKACDGKHGESCLRLAELNPGKSTEFIQKACDGGSAQGCEKYGKVLERKSGGREEAVRLYRKACDLGSISGCTRVVLGLSQNP
jgi:hypothetical protein